MVNDVKKYDRKNNKDIKKGTHIASQQYLCNALNNRYIPKMKRQIEQLSKLVLSEIDLADHFTNADITAFTKMDEIIFKCVIMAFGDTKRSPTKGIGGYTEKRPNWKSDIYKIIVKHINDLLSLESKNVSEKEFDIWHRNTCDAIRKDLRGAAEELDYYGDKEDGKPMFPYGLAQKWLNMTLKNMLATEYGEWVDKTNVLRKYFHVPVDQYVFTAVYDQLGMREVKYKSEQDKPLTLKKGGESSKPWSRLNYDMYIAFQIRVRELIKVRDDYGCPIDWEFDAWMSFKK